MERRAGVHRSTITLGGAELESLGRALGGFIQAITEPTHNIENANFAVCREYHIQQNFAFNPMLTSFGCVYRIRLTLYGNWN